MVLAKFIFAVLLTLVFAGCAEVPDSQPVNQGDGHIIKGGSLAGEGMIYFPLALPNNKK